MLEKNVTLGRSAGGGCGICDDPIKKNEAVVKVTLQVPVLITSIKVDREIHLECAERLAGMLRQRLREAGWK